MVVEVGRVVVVVYSAFREEITAGVLETVRRGSDGSY